MLAEIARLLLTVLAGLTILIGVAAPALAADDLAGEPALTDESSVSYYLWRTDDGIRLRTHGPGDAHRFVARLHTDGVFADVDTVRLESRDDVAIVNGGHTLVIRFHTFNWTDGVNFRIAGGRFLRLNLQLDGDLIDTEHIFLGADGHHPESNPFTVWR